MKCKQFTAARVLNVWLLIGEAHVRHLTDAMIVDAINQQERRFDCHAVERRLLRDHSLATAEEIIAQRGSGDPLRYFSAILSKYIDTAFRSQLIKLAKVRTPNLGGKESRNQEWEKRVPTIVVPVSPPSIEDVIANLEAEDLQE